MQQPQLSPDVPVFQPTTPDSSTGFLRSPHPSIALLLWAVAACLLTLINRFVGHFVPIPLFGSFAGHLVAIPYLLLLLLTLLKMGRAAARLPFSAPFLLIAGILFAAPVGVTLLLQNMKLFPPTWLFLTANNLFLPLAAALVGAGVGRVIKHPNTLLAAAGFSIFFDIVVVTMGTVAVLMKSKSNIIAAVSVGAGAMPTNAGPAAVALKQYDPISAVTIGPADVLFVALFLSAIYQLRLSRRETFIWMFSLLGIALLVVQITSLPIPALAPMGIAVLIANIAHAAFTKQEKRDLKIGAAFAVFCAALIVIGARTFLAPPLAPPSLGLQVARPQGMQGQIGLSPLMIIGLKPKSPAETAGLKPGDVILNINGLPATDEQFEVGRDEIRKRGGMTLTIQRRGEAKPQLVEVKVSKDNE